ncbi:hypothetical protein [Latilactobacillus curvatus]|uniref:hypothetical protein n=1 Tax=Latilactobacillus curvatus TaxID=28038 RepID=UPI00280B523A|nr:hypothetical protein [Latilactobacillus curvatus]WRS47197.1 hypothetical protein VDS61_10575 [Latilactobacillus curvatus]
MTKSVGDLKNFLNERSNFDDRELYVKHKNKFFKVQNLGILKSFDDQGKHSFYLDVDEVKAESSEDE